MVKSLITDEMIQEFNEILIKEGSILRLEKGKGTMGGVDIILQNDQYINHNSIGGLSSKFYDKLNSFFRQKGVWELNYNNTATCFWCFRE